MPRESHDLRVLYFIAYPQRMAGANRSLFELVTHLPSRVQPLVVLVDDGPVADEYRRANVPVRVLRPGPSLRSYGKAGLSWSLPQRAWIALSELLPYTWQLFEVIQDMDVDVVHVNDPRGALIAGPATRLAGRSLVAHLRGAKPFGGMYWQLFERLPHRIITVCNAIQGDLSPSARARAVTVYNGISDVSHRGATLSWLETLRQNGTLVVSCFASVTPFKGLHHLIEAAKILNARGWRDRVVFLCIGDVPPSDTEYFQHLLSLSQAYRLENFTFAGWQSDPFSFYRSTDISVLPSTEYDCVEIAGRTVEVRGNEGLPRTHLEAMCFGLPVVGTDNAGVKEVVEDGVTGFVVAPRNPVALADAIERLLANPSLRVQMGRAGRARVMERFSMDAYVAGVMRVYDHLRDTYAGPTEPPCSG